MEKQINLQSLADSFYWTQPKPEDHHDMMCIMADFAFHINQEVLKQAAHNATQQLILEHVTPSIAFDVHDSIIETINTYK